eukprot:TRINITY_DN5979_c0_g3_i1.p3 TRINITY_DN5979_c0_g3~~TRINITY_DN5979_c0_g3_i1.p3  ORF type:complete len:124 (+),score=34.30 TRINITY_DN5979_c0_g3_i1:934-1305(+)
MMTNLAYLVLMALNTVYLKSPLDFAHSFTYVFPFLLTPALTVTIVLVAASMLSAANHLAMEKLNLVLAENAAKSTDMHVRAARLFCNGMPLDLTIFGNEMSVSDCVEIGVIAWIAIVTALGAG